MFKSEESTQKLINMQLVVWERWWEYSSEDVVCRWEEYNLNTLMIHVSVGHMKQRCMCFSNANAMITWEDGMGMGWAGYEGTHNGCDKTICGSQRWCEVTSLKKLCALP